MMLACLEAPPDQAHVALQIDQTHACSRADNTVPVGALERRAGDDTGLAGRALRVDPLRDGGEPRPAVFVAEGGAAAHLGYVVRRMEPVSVAEWPTEPLR